MLVFEEKPILAGKTGGIAHFRFRLQNPKDIDAAARAVKKDEIEIWFERPTPVDPLTRRR